MTRIFHLVTVTFPRLLQGPDSFCRDQVGNIGSGGHPGHIHQAPDVRDSLLHQVNSQDDHHRHILGLVETREDCSGAEVGADEGGFVNELDRNS